MTRNKKEAENNHTNQTSHDLRKLGMHFTQPVMLRWHPPSMAFLWFVRAVAFVISASQTVIVEFRQMFYGCSSLDGPNLSKCDQNGPSHSHSFSAGVFRTSLAFFKGKHWDIRRVGETIWIENRSWNIRRFSQFKW